jgi:ABC-2 type transport system ATP-binding protein
MHFYGQLYGLSRTERTKRMNEALDVVGLGKRAANKIKTYSKGMKQRLGIAQAFFHDPDVIFLDEPTDGVDPVGRSEIRDLLRTLKDEGRTIFVNSHLLGEVEMISDRVAIIHQGKLVREGTVADLTRKENRFIIGVDPAQPFPTAEVNALGYGVEAMAERTAVILQPGQSIDPVLELLWNRGVKLRHLVEDKQSLENVFMDLVESNRTVAKVSRVARPRTTTTTTDRGEE